MRLIDADELTNEVIHDMAIAALHSNVKYFSIVNDIVVAFSETIDNAPTIDAEPIVRCKECKHRYECECPMYYEEWFTIDEGDGWCDSDFRIIDETQDDGFCYCGEREEE